MGEDGLPGVHGRTIPVADTVAVVIGEFVACIAGNRLQLDLAKDGMHSAHQVGRISKHLIWLMSRGPAANSGLPVVILYHSVVGVSELV